MYVTHRIKLELTRQDAPAMMEVARNDRYCRRLELSLYANGKPFEPTDCRVLIRYRREDGAFGEYDTMPDGVTAWEISGNTVTILLHPDVTESAEKAELEVQLLRGNTRLCMFPVDVRVRGIGKQRQPARKAEDVTGFLPQPAVARQDEFILAEKVDERGQVLQTRTAKLEMDPEKTKNMIQQTVMEYLEEHPVQGGTSGEDGKSAYAYAQDAGYTGTEAEFAAKLAEEYPPPDWQAAEGEPGHILNRTHWRDVTETVLFEQTITVANNQFLDASGVSIPLNAGETYTVVWDGVSYKTVAKDMVYNGFDAVAVGNGAFTGAGDTGEPFLILTLEGAGYGVVCLTNGEHTFTVSGNEYTYHTIPPEYLAGSKPFYIDLKTDDNYGPIIYETDITKNEVTNALVKGYQVVVRRKLPRYNLYDYFLMDRQTNGEWLYFYRIFYENRPRCEILEFRDNESGGYDITHSRHEIVNPTALKNPYALTINGTSYDGSQAVDLTEAVNNMIVAKLNAMTHAEEVAF